MSLLNEKMNSLEGAVTDLRGYVESLPTTILKPEEAVLCGLTHAQWNEVIKGEYLVQVSHDCIKWSKPETLSKAITGNDRAGFIVGDLPQLFPYCRLYRAAGTKQIWFGGEQPISDSTIILVKYKNGCISYGFADRFDWSWVPTLEGREIVEFIYLEEA